MTPEEIEHMLAQLTQLAIAHQAFNAQMVAQTGLLTLSLGRIEARLQSMDETLKGLLPQRRTNGPGS